MARPVCKGFVEIAADQSASTYPASKNSPFRPRWRYARSGPHKLSGLEGHRICQASGAPFDCQAISSSPLANIFWRSDALYVQTPEFYAAMVGCAANLCCRRSTAQAILASLLAKATTATLRWARPNSAFAHRPSGVSRSATKGGAARAPWIGCFAEICVAALADPEQLRFAAGGELPWNQPEPGGEITTALKALRSPDRGDKRRCDERADPGDGRQSAGVFILFRESDKFGVEGRDPPIELKPIARERLRRARSSAGSIPLLPVRPSARPGTARASACPARPPIRAPAEWRAAD